MSLANTIGVAYTQISHFFGKNTKNRKNFSIKDRYIKPESKALCFTYIDVETKTEYLCPTNKSLFIQAGLPYVETESKYINKLKSGLQLTCRINEKTFFCKEFADLINGEIIRKNPNRLCNTIKPTSVERQIKNRITGAINKKLKSIGQKKKNATCDVLGCDIPFFIGWLESQFIEDMGWENRGLWDIDHIIPTNLFNLKSEEEQKRAFHYSNCRPLWKKDNIMRPKDGSDTLNSPLEQRVISYWHESGMSTKRPLN
jgi:hypothetical protein